MPSTSAGVRRPSSAPSTGASHDDKAWYGGGRRAALHAGGARLPRDLHLPLAAARTARRRRSAFHRPRRRRPSPARCSSRTSRKAHAGADRLVQRDARRRTAQASHRTCGPTPASTSGRPQACCRSSGSPTTPASRRASPHLMWQFTDALPACPGSASADCSVFGGPVSQLAARAWQGRSRTAPRGRLSGHARDRTPSPCCARPPCTARCPQCSVLPRAQPAWTVYAAAAAVRQRGVRAGPGQGAAGITVWRPEG